MRAAFTSHSDPVPKMLCQLWRCWPSIEITLGEFPVSARVLALMPATAHMQCSAQAAILRQLRTYGSNVSFFPRVVRQMSPPIS